MKTLENPIPWYRSLRFRLIVTAVVIELIMLSLLLTNSFRLLDKAVESQTQAKLEAFSPCSMPRLPAVFFTAIIRKWRQSSTA